MRHLVTLVLIAAAYVGVSTVGVYLAGPNGWASVVWPGAGVALVAVLAFGPRVWPGVFLGSTLVHALLVLGPWPDFEGLLVSAGAAVGPTLSALLGAWLVRRRPGDASPLRLILLGGPLPCAVSALCSVSFLTAVGRIARDDVAAKAVTWWTGDMIGVALVAPVFLVGLSLGGRAERRAWALTIVTPVALALSLTVLVTYEAREWLDARSSLQLTRWSEVRRASVLEHVVRSADVLRSVRAFLLSRQRVTKEEGGIHQK